MDRTKHILFLHHVSFIGGAEQVLLATAQDLDPQQFHKTLIAQDEGPLTEAFRSSGGEVIICPLPAWRKGKYVLARYLTIERLVRLSRELAPDLVLTNNYRLVPYVLAVSRRFDIPGVLQLHDPVQLKHVEGFKLRGLCHIVSGADHLRSRLREFGLESRTIHYGIDAERFAEAQPLDMARAFSFPPQVRTIGMVANYTANKRHRLFLDMARVLKQLSPDFRFVLVGHNAWDTEVSEESLAALAKDQGLEAEAVFAGWRRDVPQILRALEAVVVPSEYETFPLIVLEAMAAGAIVFAQKGCGGPDEQIEDGRDGFLIDCLNADESARQIAAVMGDQGLRARVARAAQQKVRTRFSSSLYREKIREYLLNVIAEHRGSRPTEPAALEKVPA